MQNIFVEKLNQCLWLLYTWVTSKMDVKSRSFVFLFYQNVYRHIINYASMFDTFFIYQFNYTIPLYIKWLATIMGVQENPFFNIYMLDFWYAVFRFFYRTQYALRRYAVRKNLVISYADFKIYIKILQFSITNAINKTYKTVIIFGLRFEFFTHIFGK